MDFGHDSPCALRDFCIFHRSEANEPSGDKAAWVFNLVRDSGLCPNPSAINFALGRKIFRAEIFDQAVKLRGAGTKPSPAGNTSRNSLRPPAGLSLFRRPALA